MSAPSHINQLTAHLFRHESGKMVAVLTRIFGTENLQLSEDVVQETFLMAVQVWSLKGLPENPSAWLMRCAKNKAIDMLRRNKFSTSIDFSDPERKLLQSEYTLVTQMDKLWQEDGITDDLLRMMYACCHSGISAENQITLILKTLCGFSVLEIAKAFITAEDTVSKRLYRTREFFRNHKVKPAFPPMHELEAATGAVLKAIYLIFNEGYNATSGNDLIRKDLLEQAMYLCGLLCGNPLTALPEVFAAMALMCFHAARTNSRLNAEGDIVLLNSQDRSQWNAELIAEGNAYLNKAAFGTRLSSYHIEAAIAFEHCSAPDFTQTNWQRILAYYDLLLQLQPVAVVALNRLIVVYELYGADAALKEIESSPYQPEWRKQYLFYSLLGDLYGSQNSMKALASLETAITLTRSDTEKRLLRKKMEQLKD